MADISKITLPSNDEYNIKDATARSGLATKQDTLVSGTNIKTINNESLLGSGNITIQGGGDSLPDQTGHSGDILTTNGTTASWMDVSEASSVSIDTVVTEDSNNLVTSGAVYDALSNVDALPDQTGNSGKFLTTNGTDASWADIPEEIFIATYNSTSYADVLAAYNAGKTLFCARTNGNYYYLAPLVCVNSTYSASELVFTFEYTLGNTISRFSLDNTQWWDGTFQLVPSSRTINSKNLASDITLDASDVGAIAAPSSPSSGNVLTYNGSAWVASAPSGGLPDQTGNSGKYLTTNGSSASWVNAPEEIFIATYGITTYSEISAALAAGKTIFCVNDNACAALSYKLITGGASSRYFNFSRIDNNWVYNYKVMYSDSWTTTSKSLLNASSSDSHGGQQTSITNDYSNGYIELYSSDGYNTNIVQVTPTQTFLNNVVTPTDNGDAANKQYVDNAVAGSGLPSQTGNSGKYLTTNGTTASWGATSATSTKSIDSSPTSASSNLVTSGGVYTAINNKVNRTTAVNVADTNYTTLMARGIVMLDGTTYDAVSNWSNELVNGAIAWRYE